MLPLRLADYAALIRPTVGAVTYPTNGLAGAAAMLSCGSHDARTWGDSLMQYEVSFGRLDRKPRAVTPGTKFRLALLGDFSGRANAGTLEIGAALARRKPIKVDVDSLDTV